MLIRSCSQGDTPSGKKTAVIATVIHQPGPVVFQSILVASL